MTVVQNRPCRWSPFVTTPRLKPPVHRSRRLPAPYVSLPLVAPSAYEPAPTTRQAGRANDRPAQRHHLVQHDHLPVGQCGGLYVAGGSQ